MLRKARQDASESEERFQQELEKLQREKTKVRPQVSRIIDTSRLQNTLNFEHRRNQRDRRCYESPSQMRFNMGVCISKA